MTPRVVLLDSGGANLGSVQAAFARLGVEAPVTSDPNLIREASHVVLPGVGAAAVCMARLRENGLAALVPKLTQPLMGICVGMQLLYERSEEGDTECLGLLTGAVRLLPASRGIRIPHMGWNRLDITLATRGESRVAPEAGLFRQLGVAEPRNTPRFPSVQRLDLTKNPSLGAQPDFHHGLLASNHPLMSGLDGASVYFVHSYAALPNSQTLATCTHGEPFSAIAAKGRIMGAQFHPERSSAAGARLLQNFLGIL